MPSKKRNTKKHPINEYQYNVKAKVLAHHNLCIYEATILDRKLSKTKKEPQYKIHYKGWNKRWDEWVDSRRLLPINESNLLYMKEKQEKQKDIKQQQQQQQQLQNDNNIPTTTTTTKRKTKNNLNNQPPKKKRKIIKNKNNNNNNNDDDDDDTHDDDGDDNSDSDDDSDGDDDDVDNDHDDDEDNAKEEEEEEAVQVNNNNNNNIKLEIKLPTSLKKKLILDWENITKKNLLIHLPRRSGERVIDILNNFQDYAIKQGHNKNIIVEICRGIRDYFNQALEVTLLYKLERNKHFEIKNNYKQLTMDQIYGVEHLCRLFVKLPQLLAPNDLDNETRKILKQQIEYIIMYIIQNDSKYFEKNYIPRTS